MLTKPAHGFGYTTPVFRSDIPSFVLLCSTGRESVHIVSYSGKQRDTTQSTEFSPHFSSFRDNTCAYSNRGARNDVLGRQERHCVMLLCTQTPLKAPHPEGLTWFSLQLHWPVISMCYLQVLKSRATPFPWKGKNRYKCKAPNFQAWP